MMTGIFLLNQDGVCISYTAPKSEVSDETPKTMAPVLEALNIFFQNNYAGTLKGIILDDDVGDEKQIFFRNIEVQGMPLHLIAIFRSKDLEKSNNIEDIIAKIQASLDKREIDAYLNVSEPSTKMLEFLEEKTWNVL